MSFKITRKELKNNYVIVNCAYCDSQYLRLPNTVTFYNCGVYGWNWSAYITPYNNNKRVFALVDGYRSHPSSDYKNNKDYEIVRKYNEKARDVCISNQDYNIRYNYIKNLIDEMMSELEQYKK